MKEKATFYDYARMCNYYSKEAVNCKKCPLFGACSDGSPVLHADEANEIILNWCKEHPVKTRQDKFLEMFPNAHIYADGVLEIKPCRIDENTECDIMKSDCDMCRSKYWLAEVEE